MRVLRQFWQKSVYFTIIRLKIAREIPGDCIISGLSVNLCLDHTAIIENSANKQIIHNPYVYLNFQNNKNF